MKHQKIINDKTYYITERQRVWNIEVRGDGIVINCSLDKSTRPTLDSVIEFIKQYKFLQR